MIISGDKMLKCQSSDDGFHDLGVVEITEVQRGVFVQLQCNWCKAIYEGTLRGKKGRDRQ